VAERPEVQAVYLFGSLATGRAVPGSDADVLVVLDHSEERWLDRAARYRHYFAGVGLAVELFCYTPEELPSVPLARRALVEGKVLACRGTPPRP
jgi:predicted nucleotidyltransferase